MSSVVGISSNWNLNIPQCAHNVPLSDFESTRLTVAAGHRKDFSEKLSMSVRGGHCQSYVLVQVEQIVH